MTSLLSAELAATCSALGFFDAKTDNYQADGNTLETVKDLIRYLRRDDESFEIRRYLGETKVLQSDLLPLLKSYWEETDLFDILLRLVVNLTTPALILWNEELPTEKTSSNYYLQIEDHLLSYKEAFVDEGIWAVLSTRLSKILEIDYAERGDENSLIIERVLVLIRNVLYVPADTMENRPDNDASIHDQVLWALHQSGTLDIILYITGTSAEQAYYMHVLEILSFMLREQKPGDLATAALQRSRTEKVRDEAELLAIRYKETNKKQQKAKMYTGTRHSRFGGTFVVQSMKSISDNELIYHKPLNKLDSLNFDVDKKKPKTPKNRLPLVNTASERRSAFTVRLVLKEFCVEFLTGAYNTLMHNVKINLSRVKAQTHDESYYLWALRFFMEFNRCYNFEMKLISETMSVPTFHYVQQQTENYFDLIKTDKKKMRLWSRRLHLALLAYRELFMTLNEMDKSRDGTVRDTAKVLKSNIFYVPEYREFVLTLLVTYDEVKMSDVYLKDLIETQHVFLRMLESFCGESGSVVVQRKQRVRKLPHKKASTAAAATASGSQAVQDLNLVGRWDEVAPQLSVVMQKGEELDKATALAVPFDAASDVPIDEQKADAMKNVQRKLRNGHYEGAVGLLRAARDVWPENDSFGSNNMTPEEEFLALREIFFADLGENTPNLEKSLELQNESEEDDYGEEEEGPQYMESDFQFQDFLKRLPHPKIVRACGLALKNFENNAVNTNQCIVKLLHRIAFDCKMYVMLFQVSIFRTFQKIFGAKDLPQHKELVKFATYIIRQFFKVADVNKTVFMEALFWKSNREAYEIEAGYGSYNEKSKAALQMWSEEQENELRHLFMEHQEKQIEEDVVDWIVNNLIDNTRSRRAVLKKLKEMYLLDEYKGKKKSSVKLRSWSGEEEDQLKEIYNEFKESDDPLGNILSRLEISRPKNRVIEKMLVMGLIQDKKELRKRRQISGKQGKSERSKNTSDSDESNHSSDSDDDIHTLNAFRPKPKAKNKKTTKSSKNQHSFTKAPITTIVKLILDNMKSGRQEALEWLKESLSDAIENSEDGEPNNEGIPLVPIMDYAEAAMENAEFQRTLKVLGICEPFDEQESYWRIPADLDVYTLNSYCNLIQEALDQTLVMPQENPQDTDNKNLSNAEESDDEDIFNKLRQMAETNKNSKLLDNQNQNNAKMHLECAENYDNSIVDNKKGESSNDKDMIEDEEHVQEITNRKNNRRNVIDSDDEENNEITNKEHINEDSIVHELAKIKQKKIHVIDSDEETEKEINNENHEITKLNEFGKKRGRSDSNDEMPNSKCKRDD